MHRRYRHWLLAALAAFLIIVIPYQSRLQAPSAPRPLRHSQLSAARAPIVDWTEQGSYSVGGPGAISWSFQPPSGNGYQGWAQAWDQVPVSAAFTSSQGFLTPGSLSAGPHHVELAFFFSGQPPVVVSSPLVSVGAPRVSWHDQGTFTSGSPGAVTWSFTPPSSAGYQGWAQGWDVAPRAPNFRSGGGFLVPGSLATGIHHVEVAFFFAGQAPVVVSSPAIAVVASGAPRVSWSAPASVDAGSSMPVRWSFSSPSGGGYQGWAQAWDSSPPAATFGSSGGFLLPGAEAPSPHTVVLGFFYAGRSPVYEASPAVAVSDPQVNWSVQPSYAQGGAGIVSWSFAAPFGGLYQGWAQSWDSPAAQATFNSGGGFMPAGALGPGAHQAMVTFFFAGQAPIAMASPSFTVAPLALGWQLQSSYIAGSAGTVGWSFTPPAFPGYLGWAQSWDQPANAATFSSSGGYLSTGNLAPGTHTAYVTFFSSYGPPVAMASPPVMIGPDYVAGSTGYDISFPQCGSPYPSGPHPVAIVGATGGSAFTTNQCLASEAAWAGPGLNLYVNVNQPSWNNPAAAYTGPDASCAAGGSATCQSYDYGWNDAQAAMASAASQGVHAPVWWLDVECPPNNCSWSSNYWSTNLAANASVMQGAIDAFKAAGDAAGVYGTAYQWDQITGGTTPGVPVWYAGWSGPASSYCTNPASGFTGGPVWLVQGNPAQTNDVFDPDTAC